jgi:putative membrane protein insertion efficiency factor
MSDHRPTAAARLLTVPIRGYQRFLSPLFPPVCRFYPSCSAYAVEALRVHGAVRGLWLTVRRIARCHPFHPGGLDPVPPRRGTAVAHDTGPGADGGASSGPTGP